MGEEEATTATPTRESADQLMSVSVCEECKTNASKYKCPGCGFRSCSLPCVKAHKQRTGCTGKRDRSSFLPLSQFNDNVLLSDYNLLEEVKTVAESAQRRRTKICGAYTRGFTRFKIPLVLRNLHSAAASRRTRLLFLPTGMFKRDLNQSQYNPKRRFISWTIEWRFHSESGDVVLHDHGVNEETKLVTLVEKHLQPGPWKHQLRRFCDYKLEDLKFFIRKSPKGPKPRYRKLDIKSSIRPQLANLAILEYPVVHVFLPMQKYDFEVDNDKPTLSNPDIKTTSSESLSQKGVCFREEEIEDTKDFEPITHDQHVNSTTEKQLCPESVQSTTQNTLDEAFLGRNTPKESSNNIDVYDEGLFDVYSDLISQMNPDDFLNLDGEFAREGEFIEIRPPGDGNLSLVDEELEEGEILE